jgi:predicted ribosome quality control (RQC) complex YloA/Tae2 family protein
MNNYYTLIYLIREWKETLIGSRFDVALSTRRNLLELFFENDDKQFRLIFSSTPQNAALFLDRYQNPKRQNTASFFDELHLELLVDIELADSDRFITFKFESSRDLIFLLYSNHANALLSVDGKIGEAFKKEKSLIEQITPDPVPVKSSKPLDIRKVNDVIAQVDPLLPRNMVRNLLREFDISENAEEAINKVQAFRSSLVELAHPHYSEEFGFSIANPVLLGLSEFKNFGSVNEAVAYSFFKWVRYNDFESKKRQVLDRINRAISRTHIAISELSASGDASEKSELFEKYGHLLMASPTSDVTSGVVFVNDYFADGIELNIKVDPNKSIVENAKEYYQKSKSVKRLAETYSRRLHDFQKKVGELESMLHDLHQVRFGRDLEKWLKSNENSLKRIGYSEADSIQVAQHFRSYQFNNYEIRVGKSATSNDELLRISKKDDIWLHARGVAGSHVVIPMNKNLQLPPPEVMDYAAGLAAFFSKAKGSSLVPVIFTRKKFVRKSKGMAPGAVLVDKEDVLLVPPQKPDELNAED